MQQDIKNHKIVLGTGFNKWLLGSNNNILTDWWTLLKAVAEHIGLSNIDELINNDNSNQNDCNFHKISCDCDCHKNCHNCNCGKRCNCNNDTNQTVKKSSPTFVWETLISFYCQENPKFSMSECENHLLKIVAKLINEETDKLLDNEDVKKRFNIFWDAIKREDRLDIVSLNFDLIIETLLQMKKEEAITWYESNKERTLRRLHTKIAPASHFQKDNVYIWHPHGHIKHPKSMIVGLHRYVQSANQIISDFNNFKAFYQDLPNTTQSLPTFNPHHYHEGIKTLNRTTTWLGATINHSLLFVGVGLSIEEVDIWEYIHLRFRNHARVDIDKPNIIRFTCDQDNNDCTHWKHLSQLLHIQNQSFGENWDIAWNDLINSLKV